MSKKEIMIGLCDDNGSAIEQLQELIKEYLTKKKIEARILSFLNAEELLNHVEEIREQIKEDKFLEVEVI